MIIDLSLIGFRKVLVEKSSYKFTEEEFHLSDILRAIVRFKSKTKRYSKTKTKINKQMKKTESVFLFDSLVLKYIIEDSEELIENPKS